MNLAMSTAQQGLTTRHKLVWQFLYFDYRKLDNKKQLEIHNRVKQLYARK
jgi:hypothetical protein